MSQMQNTKAAAAKEIDEYECSGNGPRPPVPGKESRTTKMTETGCPSTSTAGAGTVAAVAQPSFVVPHADDIIADCARVKKWREKLSNLLSDEKGVDLFQKFVEYEAGPGGPYTIHLEFYFACEGLKQETNPKTARDAIHAIYRTYLRSSGNDISVPPDLRTKIRETIKNGREPDVNIFRDVQRDVEQKITMTTFPKFFESKFYFDYSEQVQKPRTVLNNNYSIGSAYGGNGSNSGHYGGEMMSGWTTATDFLSPCDSLGASCSNLQESLTMNSLLPTLHENQELKIQDVASTKSLSSGASTQPKLTRDLLLATQNRRLDVRPAGAHGYDLKFSTSFNPVSRQDSERQSRSSASQTDSDTKSLVSSKDGQPYMHRNKTSTSDSMKRPFLNDSKKSIVEPYSRERLEASKQMDPKKFCEILKKKLEELKVERDKEERFQNALNEANADEPPMCSKSFVSKANAGQVNHQAFTSAILRKISTIDLDNDQDILDQHVSRVFSPLVQSPGTASPRQAAAISSRPPPLPHRSIDPMPDFASLNAMRHAKSIPDHTACSASMSRKPEKIYYDSGISGISMNYGEIKTRDTKPTNTPHAQTRKALETVAQPQPMPTTSMTNSLPRIRDQDRGCYTWCVYQFCDETVPYRNKLYSENPTLKMFKEVLHKKGNFRYFFKSQCEELQAPVQEEFTQDSDILPLFEGKVMGLVTPL